jgi:hypothetical protein
VLGPIGDAFAVRVSAAQAGRTKYASLAPNCSSAVSASPFSNGSPRVLPVGEKLNAEESAAIIAQPADAHHLRFAQLRAMGRKVSDEFPSTRQR